MDENTPRWETVVYMAVLGVGLGLVMQVLTIIVQNAVEPRDLGVATSSAQFFRSMGASLGVALWLGPFAMLGALIGRPVVNHLNQRMFELTALALTFGAAILMIR